MNGKILVTGGSGVLGRAFVPTAGARGLELLAPSREELDLFDPSAVADAVRGCMGVVHLATKIRPLSDMHKPDLWRENDRLRAEASKILTEACHKTGVEVYVQPTVTFVYPNQGEVDEQTPVRDVLPILRSALTAEAHTLAFAGSNRRGVVLRLGLLDGPGTGNDEPKREMGATLHVADAGEALLAALTIPSGIYNVCRDGERVSNKKFRQTSGWAPSH